MSQRIPSRSSHKQIERDVIHLQESMSILHDLVKEQQEPLDTLEDFIHESKENVKQAEELIHSTSYFTSLLLYIAGGLVTIIYFII